MFPLYDTASKLIFSSSHAVFVTSERSCTIFKCQGIYCTPIVRSRVSASVPFTPLGGREVRGHSRAPLYLRHSKYRFFQHVPVHPDLAV
jgi:hypothetical protein